MKHTSNAWRLNDLGDHLDIPRTTISYNCEKLLEFGILMKNEEDQLFLNSEYEIWIKKVVKKDR